MRVPGNRSRNSSNSEKAAQEPQAAASGDDKKEQEGESNSGPDHLWSRAVSENKRSRTRAAVKSFHEKPQPTHEKSHAPPAQHIHQPRKHIKKDSGSEYQLTSPAKLLVTVPTTPILINRKPASAEAADSASAEPEPRPPAASPPLPTSTATYGCGRHENGAPRLAPRQLAPWPAGCPVVNRFVAAAAESTDSSTSGQRQAAAEAAGQADGRKKSDGCFNRLLSCSAPSAFLRASPAPVSASHFAAAVGKAELSVSC
uniref:Uncharacterized protein n=1 Tax=Macrostomum lignano TaxID=282301 RepID=A0A1I8FS05_9PLAT